MKGVWIMGYILPIQNFQYYDYHHRINHTKKDPYFIDKPFKAILEAEYEDINHHPVEAFNKSNDDIGQRVYQQHRLETAAQFTGKGMIYDTRV